MKDFLFNKLFTLRRLFLWGNVLLLILFLAVLLKDSDRGWKKYQEEYRNLEIRHAKETLSRAQTDEEREAAQKLLKTAQGIPIEIRQIWVQKLGAVDRCITCHMGYDPLTNTSLTTTFKDHPYSASGESPALDIHKAHDLEKFGCVVCHGGQGYATETEAAHGFVPHWEKPLLSGAILQASCAKCHDNTDELTVNGVLYTKDYIHGKELFRKNNCIGCHQIDGEGGPISVDLMHETSRKSLTRIDFSHTGLPHKDRILQNWIKLHLLKDPATLAPGDPAAEFNSEPIAPSGMPPFYMNEEDANALTAFILGLNREGIPPEYRVRRAPEQEPTFWNPVARGRHVFEKYGCGACHGIDGRGGIRNYNYQYDVMPNLRRSVATFTRAELREKISVGVPIVAKRDPKGPNPPLYMPAWGEKISDDEMDSLISYLISIED